MSIPSPSVSVSPFSVSLFLLLIPYCWSCDPRDRAALLDFSNALDSPLWSSVANGTASDCCTWVGVTCSGNESSTPPRVVQLLLQNMRLSGPVSTSLGRLDRLKLLVLYGNNLSGPIPSELFHPPSLEQINLGNNNFTGPLSPAFGKLVHLVSLRVAQNNLSGSIPDAFGRLQNLNDFIAHENKFGGSIPTSLSSCPKLRFLHLRDNMSGPIGLNFTALRDLESLLLQNNHFTGRIPGSLSSCRKLRALNLSGNNLHGQIPWGFEFPSSLLFVLLGYNNFSNITSALSSLQGCRNLTGLSLSGNFNKEEMPQDPIIEFPNLKAISISSSELYGSFPMWLSKSEELVMLNLSHNSLTGDIPLFFTQLKSLTGSEMQNGYITTNITDGRYSISFSVKPTLDLSSNSLSGNTWMRLSSLTKLNLLNLSHNSFTGSIPDNFSEMKSLQSLDMSWNKICGVIPASLQQLTSMSFFCVANNNLSGDVPKGSQFPTFSSSCFDGNPGLCYVGKPGCHPPPSVGKPVKPYKQSYKVIDMGVPFAVGVSLGYAATFLVSGTYFCWTGSQQLTKNKRRR